MRSFRMVLLAVLLTVPWAATAVAQDQYLDDDQYVGIGPEVVPAPVIYGPPVCEWGYYAYYPYACAPYGYYGPDWFYGGVFIGVGPWYHWGWGHPGWGHHGWGHPGWDRGGRGWRGNGDHGGFGRDGSRQAYGGTARSFNGGGRNGSAAPRGGYGGGRAGGSFGGSHSGGFGGSGRMSSGGGFGGGGRMGGGGGGHR
jgi:hypothetical protein